MAKLIVIVLQKYLVNAYVEYLSNSVRRVIRRQMLEKVLLYQAISTI